MSVLEKRQASLLLVLQRVPFRRMGRAFPKVRIFKNYQGDEAMNLYLVGNVVLYDGKKWEITSFGTDGKGHTTVNLARGEFRVSVLESEIERVTK